MNSRLQQYVHNLQTLTRKKSSPHTIAISVIHNHYCLTYSALLEIYNYKNNKKDLNYTCWVLKFDLAPGAGFEPAAYWLTANRSTAELPRNMCCIIASF